MSVVALETSSSVENYKRKCRRLVVPFSITYNATPADKVVGTDLPDAVILRTEGLTANADAKDDDGNFTTPVDATGIFGILLYNLGTASKVLKYSVDHASSGTVAVSLKGASSTGVTASGNLAIEVDSSLNLSTTSLSAVLTVEYVIPE